MTDPRDRLRERLAEPSKGDDARQQLRDRLAEPEDGTTALGSFLTQLFKSVGDAAGSVVPGTGDLLAMGAAGIEGTARGLTPGGEGFDYRRRYQEEQQKFPASLIRSVPRISTNQMLALRSGIPGMQAALEAQDAVQREEHPIASGLGDFGGTVASLLLAKRPLQNSIRRAEDRIINPPARVAGATRRLSDDLDIAFRSSWTRLPARGVFRAGETGLEAAFLEVLSEAENDPMLAAGLAAGGQVASSGLYGGLKSLLSGGVGSASVKFTTAAIATGGLWQMAKSATPGGRDRILESLETGFDKTTYAVLLGVLGSAMGARGRGKDVSEALQNVIEGFTTLPRAGVLGLITEFANAPEAEQQMFESTLNKILADPVYAGETDFERDIISRLKSASEAQRMLDASPTHPIRRQSQAAE